VAVSSHCPGGGAAAARACRLCGVRRACRAQVRPGARVIPGALDLRRSPKAMGLGAQGSSAGPQGHGPRQGPWISRARTMAPVGPHDHVANEVRLRGRRTDAHLSPTTVLDPQFVSGIPARQTRQSERGRARTEALCPRFGCLFAVGFTRSVHWSSLLRPACSFVRGRNRRAARPRRSPRVRAPPLPSGSPSGAPCRPVVCARPRGPATVCWQERTRSSNLVPTAFVVSTPNATPAGARRLSAARPPRRPGPELVARGAAQDAAPIKNYVLNCK
jgi:hypothetical protein